MAKCSNLTIVSSTAPSCIDWEGRDQDEVPTGRRVATVTRMAQSGQSRTQLAERVWARGSAIVVSTVIYVQPGVNP